jgi:hypothetical protein
VAQFLLLTTLLSIAALIATSVMGFRATPVSAADHIFFALATVVLGLFSQSMTMFFFIGTGKEIKEKANNDARVVQQTKQFKSQVFPAAMWAMTALMITFIMGGGVASGRTLRWVHDLSTVITIATFARAYWVQIRAMNENATLMERYLRE